VWTHGGEVERKDDHRAKSAKSGAAAGDGLFLVIDVYIRSFSAYDSLWTSGAGKIHATDASRVPGAAGRGAECSRGDTIVRFLSAE